MTVVAIDGIDGSGKSTLATALASRIRDAVLVPEFSSGELGAFLSAQVRTRPHFIAESELAQSLLFLAEYADRVDHLMRGIARSPHDIRILERGWLSKYSYQVSVLQRRYPYEQARSVVADILSLIPSPDRTILLTASESALRQRLSARTVVIDDAYFAFLRDAERTMTEAVADGFGAFVLDTSSLSALEVADAAEDYVRSVTGLTPRPRATHKQ